MPPLVNPSVTKTFVGCEVAEFGADPAALAVLAGGFRQSQGGERRGVVAPVADQQDHGREDLQFVGEQRIGCGDVRVP